MSSCGPCRKGWYIHIIVFKSLSNHFFSNYLVKKISLNLKITFKVSQGDLLILCTHSCPSKLTRITVSSEIHWYYFYRPWVNDFHLVCHPMEAYPSIHGKLFVSCWISTCSKFITLSLLICYLSVHCSPALWVKWPLLEEVRWTAWKWPMDDRWVANSLISM